MERREHYITNASIKLQDGLTIVANYGLFLNLFMVCLVCGFVFFPPGVIQSASVKLKGPRLWTV